MHLTAVQLRFIAASFIVAELKSAVPANPTATSGPRSGLGQVV